MQTIEEAITVANARDGMLVAQFQVADAIFGVDARLVLEVVKIGEVTPVHGAPDGIYGVRNLRGRIVTVVDMATHLGLGCVEIGPETRLLIMEQQGESFGFLVDAVTDAIALDPEQINAPPAGMDSNLRSRLTGVLNENDSLTAILDPETLFRWNEE